MDDKLHRGSRADRVRSDSASDESRVDPSRFKALSQVIGSELQIFVQNGMTGQNYLVAKETIFEHLTREQKAPDVILDMAKADLVDTRGLSLLMEIKKQIGASGRSLTIQNPSRSLLRIMNITRMTKVIPVRVTASEDQEKIPGLGGLGGGPTAQ